MDRLKKRADFLAAAQGPRVARPAFIVQARLRDDNGPTRIGFTVSKKVGTATERNRVRRRLREMVKLAGLTSPSPLLPRDYVIVGRRTALERDFMAMVDDFRSALHRLSRAGSHQIGATDSDAKLPARLRDPRPHTTGPTRPDR